jgi:PiT family inorganic phosphate transporter
MENSYPLNADVPGIPVRKLERSIREGWLGSAVFGAALLAGLLYVGANLIRDLGQVHAPSVLPYVLLVMALLVALGFEFVNGFHDTANAVATVIYTHSLTPRVAVVWSGMWNFAGVLFSSGVVAFAIVSLLPVELILQVGTTAGFAMVFALLVAAIIWNLGTWYFGLPSSSSHTLIGSIIGVGIANQLMAGQSGTSGVDWMQAGGVMKSLLISPLVGFVCAGLLLLIAKRLIPSRELYVAPESQQPPPLGIRCLLVLTCTGVSFAHGSNDGQKGMGLIMLILIGTVPTAYALNHTISSGHVQQFVVDSRASVAVLDHYVGAEKGVQEPRRTLTDYLRDRHYTTDTTRALRQLVNDTSADLAIYRELQQVPPERVRNFRNDLYLVSETLGSMVKSNAISMSAADAGMLRNYRSEVDTATKFIPGWVKVAVAIALGLGTMVGWKRIVITVGEKIGKEHLTYGQGAAAELTAMATIGAADAFGLPVSTTHVLSSGVAGTMAANHSGLQWGTVRSLLVAWVLTLPASILLSGTLYWAFRRLAE